MGMVCAYFQISIVAPVTVGHQFLHVVDSYFMIIVCKVYIIKSTGHKAKGMVGKMQESTLGLKHIFFLLG